MTVSEFPILGAQYADQETFNRQAHHHAQLAMQGKLNNVIEVTLDANDTSTTVTDARIGVNTVAVCIPMTANAAAETAPYRDVSAPVNGSMSLIHSNTAGVDKTYKVILIG